MLKMNHTIDKGKRRMCDEEGKNSRIVVSEYAKLVCPSTEYNRRYDDPRRMMDGGLYGKY